MARGAGVRGDRNRDAIAADAADDHARQVEQHAQQADVRPPTPATSPIGSRRRLSRPSRPDSSCWPIAISTRRSHAPPTRGRQPMDPEALRLCDRASFGLLFQDRGDTLAKRVLEAGGMEHWESGMDLKLGDDIYDNFRHYQRQLIKAYGAMADEFDSASSRAGSRSARFSRSCGGRLASSSRSPTAAAAGRGHRDGVGDGRRYPEFTRRKSL